MWFACWEIRYITFIYFVHILSYTQNERAVGFEPLMKQLKFYRSWLCVDTASVMVS